MKLHSTKYIFALLIISAILITGCSSATETPEAPPEPIAIKVSRLPFLSFSPYFIAEAEGFFNEEGLEVEFVQFERGADAIAALADGQIDVWGGATSVSILNAAQRSPVQIVGGRGYLEPGGCGYTAFLLRSELVDSGEVTTPEQLAERRIVQDREGGFRDYFLRTMLKQAGLSLEDAEEVITIPDAVVIDAFDEGSIDLAAMGEPWVTRISRTGDAEMWMTFEDVLPDYQFGLIAFSERMLNDEPEAGRRFMLAFLRGVEQYNQGKTERNLEILTEATGLDRELLEEACWPAFRENGQINTASIMDFQSWALENGYMESSLTEDELWTSSFVEYALQKLGK
jgi:NitT/TauT family transport system substrate-binding protein